MMIKSPNFAYNPRSTTYKPIFIDPGNPHANSKGVVGRKGGALKLS